MNFAIAKGPAMEMLSMLKHSLVTNEGSNPITKHFNLVKYSANAGPEMVWKIYDAIRISDKKEVSVFMFEKRIADKLHKPKRREMVTEVLRREVKNLSKLKHPKILRVIHPLEECHESLAFATEPVVASLANLLGHTDRLPANISQELKDHSFMEIEIKYGILQIAEALWYLHISERILHGNVCPASIIVTKRGMWKLAGLGFAEKPKDGKDAYPLTPWSSKMPKMAQPDLDYIAPEQQLETAKHATTLCDMFSFGMVICAIYNDGHSLIQANHNTATYVKKTEMMTELFSEVAHRMPLPLVEPVEKMINKDIRYRPTSQSFMLLRYFDDLVVRCMQMLDAVDSKDLSQKIEFFTKLTQAVPNFPRKLLYNSVFPMLQEQLNYSDMLVLVLPSLLCMIEHATNDDYKLYLQPELRRIFNMSRPVQGTVYLLEKLDIIMAKSTEEEIKSDVLPMIFSTLESNSIQGQEAAINVFSTIKKYLDDQTMRKLVLPKAKGIFTKSTNVRTKLNALACIHRLIDTLDKMMILDEVLPFLTEIQCQDVDIIMSVVGIYKHMLQDKKYGLTQNLLATKVMPTLIPYTATPGLDLDQFNTLMGVLREMLDQVDRQRRSKMLSEVPDHNALELRRTSIDMRYTVFDPPKQEGTNKLNLLSVDEAYYNNRFRRKSFDYRGAYNRYGYRQAPSTPELQTRGSSESLGPKTYRRHSSFQGLGVEEQAVLDKIVRERRASLVPPQPGNPHILVSEASGSDLSDPMFFGTPRRSSTQSMGPVVEPGRRDSRGRLLDLPNQQRRSSFQGICESAMQFFVGK